MTPSKTAHLPLELLEAITQLLHELPAKYSRVMLNALDTKVTVTEDAPPEKAEAPSSQYDHGSLNSLHTRIMVPETAPHDHAGMA